MISLPSPPPTTGDAEVPLTIVIPVGTADIAWETLLPHLIPRCPEGTEIILSATEPEPVTLREHSALAPGLAIRWICGPAGRGRQLNRGVRASAGRFLWLLHADSRPCDEAVATLLRCVRGGEDALWYFDLRYLPDGPRLMLLNEIGAWVRSRLLGLPFGDQGFVLARSLFERLGDFSETAEYGEDHLFVWAARHAGVRVRPIGRPLLTSARKYAQRGWFTTTFRHLWLTWKQAAPEILRPPRPEGAKR